LILSLLAALELLAVLRLLYSLCRNAQHLAAYESVLKDTIPNSHFHAGDVADFSDDCDTFVSAANSRLTFNGGSDFDYIEIFGNPEQLMNEQLTEFWNDHPGVFGRCETPFLPVGAAMRRRIIGKLFIVAPTMLTPQKVHQTKNAYHAFKAVLELLDKDPIASQHVLVPGLCTGYGKMDATKSALQVKDAWLDHAAGKRSCNLHTNNPDIVCNTKVLHQQPHFECNLMYMGESVDKTKLEHEQILY
jgi:O-acetyl-ADP-ribose deacetylase (regulator of RNase III)